MKILLWELLNNAAEYYKTQPDSPCTLTFLTSLTTVLLGRVSPALIAGCYRFGCPQRPSFASGCSRPRGRRTAHLHLHCKSFAAGQRLLVISLIHPAVPEIRSCCLCVRSSFVAASEEHFSNLCGQCYGGSALSSTCSLDGQPIQPACLKGESPCTEIAALLNEPCAKLTLNSLAK